MGILDRLLRGGTRTIEQELTVTFVTRVRPDGGVQVVGETYRQNLVVKAPPPAPGELPQGLPAPAGYFEAMIALEPDDEYDRDALKLRLRAGPTWNHLGFAGRTQRWAAARQ